MIAQMQCIACAGKPSSWTHTSPLSLTPHLSTLTHWGPKVRLLLLRSSVSGGANGGLKRSGSSDGRLNSPHNVWRRKFVVESNRGSLQVSISQEVDVAIVGGGPGGLAAANAIRKTRPDVSIGVYERSAQLLRVGWAISIAYNGMHALQAISQDLCDEVSRHCLNKPMVIYDLEGNVIRNVPFHVVLAEGHEDVNPGNVPWYMLQRVLAASLSSEYLHLGHSFEALEQDADGVTLQLSSAGGGSVGVRAKVVIGADGNRSAVRQSIFHDGPPSFLNTAIWRGQCEMPSDWAVKDEGILAWVDEAGSNFFVLAELPGKVIAWQLMSPWPAERLDELASARYVDADAMGPGTSTKMDRCLSKLRGRFPDWSVDLVSNTDLTRITEHGQFYREAEACKKWTKGRVALLGDAAHLFTPFLGQGLNQTLEDAVAIGRSIGKYGCTTEALLDYETERASYATSIQAASVQMAKDVFLHKLPNGEMEWAAANRDKTWRRHPPLQTACS